MKTRFGRSGRAFLKWPMWAAAGIVCGLGVAGAANPPSDKGDKVVTGGDLAFMNDAGPGGQPKWS